MTLCSPVWYPKDIVLASPIVVACNLQALFCWRSNKPPQSVKSVAAVLQDESVWLTHGSVLGWVLIHHPPSRWSLSLSPHPLLCIRVEPTGEDGWTGAGPRDQSHCWDPFQIQHGHKEGKAKQGKKMGQEIEYINETPCRFTSLLTDPRSFIQTEERNTRTNTISVHANT